MNILKKIISGCKGKTVFYSVPDVKIENDTLLFGAFRFFTPAASLQDTEGNFYFDVPGDSVSVWREACDYDLFVRVQEAGTEAVKVYNGYEPEHHDDGLEGDVIIHAFVPADLSSNIEVIHKEIV